MTESIKCDCCGEREANCNTRAWGFADPLYNLSSECIYEVGGRVGISRARGVLIERVVARRSAALNQPRCYGQMPAVLPKVLPAGTRMLFEGMLFLSQGTCVIDEFDRYYSTWLGGGQTEAAYTPALARYIDWMTVLVQDDEAPNSFAESFARNYPEIAKAEPPKCRDCSAPIPNGYYDQCIYCSLRLGPITDELQREGMDRRSEAAGHRRKLEAALAAEKRPVNRAEAKELGKRQPWSCDE